MKKLLWLTFSGLIPMCILFVALYLFDPLQIFHKPYWRENFFSSNIREQIPGIVKNYNFDSVILGSSLLANTSSKEADKKIGGHWVNFAIPGGSPIEKLIILNFVLKTKKINKIIFSVSDFEFRNNNYNLINSNFFSTNPIVNLLAYGELKFVFCIFQDNFCIKDKQIDIDRLSRWGNKEWVNPLLGGLDSWITNANKQDTKKSLEAIVKIDKQKESFSIADEKISELQTLLKQNPKTTFFLVIPPISRIYYKVNETQTKQIIKKILLLKLSNVFIYGFDNTNIPDDISRYIDLVHYDEKVNSFMLDAIKNDTHRITLENVDNYFEEMRKKVEAYDIEPLRKQIIESGVLSH